MKRWLMAVALAASCGGWAIAQEPEGMKEPARDSREMSEGLDEALYSDEGRFRDWAKGEFKAVRKDIRSLSRQARKAGEPKKGLRDRLAKLEGELRTEEERLNAATEGSVEEAKERRKDVHERLGDIREEVEEVREELQETGESR